MSNIWHFRSKDQCQDPPGPWKTSGRAQLDGTPRAGQSSGALAQPHHPPHGTQWVTQWVSSTSPTRLCSILHNALPWEENLGEWRALPSPGDCSAGHGGARPCSLRPGQHPTNSPPGCCPEESGEPRFDLSHPTHQGREFVDSPREQVAHGADVGRKLSAALKWSSKRDRTSFQEMQDGCARNNLLIRQEHTANIRGKADNIYFKSCPTLPSIFSSWHLCQFSPSWAFFFSPW